MKIYNYLYIVVIVLLTISCNSNSFYENSKKLRNGMGVNETIKYMGEQPSSISDIEHRYNNNYKMRFIYIDSKKGYNIYIYFDNNLRICQIDYLD